MAIAVRWALVALALFGASAGASASTDEGSRAVTRISLLDGPNERLVIADDVFEPTFPALRPPKLVLTGAQRSGARPAARPPMLRLMIDPQFCRWQIDALGGAWFTPVVTGGAFVGRLLFRF